MADKPELGFDVVAEIGKGKSFKSIDEYAKYLESQIGGAVDKSLLKPLDTAGKKWQYMIKAGRQYRRVVVSTKDGNLSSFDISKQGFTKKQAGRILSAQTDSGAKAIINEVSKEQKLTNELLRTTKKKAQLKASSDLKMMRANQLSSILGNNFSQQDLLRFELSNAKSKLNSLIESFYELEKEGGEAFDTTKQKIIETSKQVTSLKKELDKVSRKGPIEELVNTFKRVGFYRIARRVFQVIEQGLSQSITNLAKFDDGVNDTMGSITSQITILSNSFSVMLAPLLKIVEPVLKSVTKVVADLASSVSYLVAKLSGSATYLKANTEYAKEFNKELNNLSFDKFESLSMQDDPASMFEEANVADGLSDGMERVLNVLEQIGGLLLAIGAYKFVTWITDGSAKTFFTDAKDGLGKIKGKIDDISTAGLIASSAFAFVTSIINLIDVIKNWDSQSLLTQITAITSAFLALAAVVFSILAAIPAIGHTAVFKAIAVGTTAGAVLAGTVSAMRFAEGGRPEQGSLFIAGEAGAELVTTMPSGQTGVTNISQFKQAMVEAIYECSDVFQNSTGEVVLNLDGATIARSKSFKSELNRTNAGLNLR